MTRRALPAVAATLAALLLAAPAAAAPMTRIDVRWSSQTNQEYPPYLNSSVGQYAGRCSDSPNNCNAAPGFHWEEAEFSPAGYPRRIALVDDQPERARQVCVEAQHPFDPSITTGGRIDGDATLTATHGATRTASFSVDKGQRQDLGCTPDELPPAEDPRGCPALGVQPVVIVEGDPEDERLVGTPGNDEIRGGGGHDSLLGFAGSDCLIGGAGDDMLSGGPGTDQLTGGSGDDVLVDTTAAGAAQQQGGDIVSCGPGNDIAIVDGTDSVIGCESQVPELPEAGKTVLASVVEGTVRVKRPGALRFVKLKGAQTIPNRSQLDTRRGTVRLTADAGGGALDSGDFEAGRFRLRLKGGPKPFTQLRLIGRLTGCRAPGGATASRRRKGRRLWGTARGRFRTRGRRSVSIVTGTKWLTADRCDGATLTRVVSGRVKVRDLVRRRTVRLRAGERYVARPRR